MQNVTGINIPKYKGTIVNDTTLVGGFLGTPNSSIVNGNISKDGKRITCATAASDPSYNFFRASFALTKK